MHTSKGQNNSATSNSSTSFNPNTLSIVPLQCFVKYISPNASNSLNFDEMSNMVNNLVIESANAEEKIKRLKEENENLKTLIKNAAKENRELNSYKDKLTAMSSEYQLKQKETENLHEVNKKKLESNESLKKELEKMKFMKDNIKNKEKEVQQAKDELTTIKNFPKEKLIKEAVIKAEKAEQKKQEIENEYQICLNNLKLSNDQLTQITNEYNELQEKHKKDKERLVNNKQQLENKINELKNEMKELTSNNDGKLKKYQELLLEIKSLQDSNESLRKEASETKSQTHNLMEQLKNRKPDKLELTSITSSEQMRETLIEHFSLIYSNEMSISFLDIIKEAIQNFDIILHTIFINEKETKTYPSSITYSQDIIRDIYRLLYIKALEMKSTLNIISYSPLSVSDFNEEVFKQILKSFIKYNEISQQCKGGEEVIENIIKKIDALHLNEEISNKIKGLFKEKIEKEQSSLITSLSNLIKKCINTVVNGNIFYHDKILFQYRTFISSGISINNNSLNVDLSQLTMINSNYLMTILKYPNEKSEISKVSFTNSFDYNRVDIKSIFQIFYSLLTSSPNILSFSLVSCVNLNDEVLNCILFLIKNLKNIKILRLENVGLNDQSMKNICEEIKDHKSLKALMFSKNNLSSISGSYLAGLISVNKNINILYLDHNNITSSGLAGLLACLYGSNANNKVLKIDLSYNSLKTEDILEVGKLLRTNPKLQMFNISGNKLEMRGIVELGLTINCAKQIIQLGLADMNINSDACPQIFNTMFIEELILDDNPIGVIGLMMFAKTITANNTIKKLSLKNTNLEDMSIGLIVSWLNKNLTLKEIHLEENKINEDGISNFSILMGMKTECKFFISKSKIDYQKHKEVLDQIKNVIVV